MAVTRQFPLRLALAAFGLALLTGQGLADQAPPGARLNVPVKTLGGVQLWADRKVFAGWRIQENIVSGHHRLLDDRDIRRGWGTLQACETLLSEAEEEHGLQRTSTRAVVMLHGLGRSKRMFRELEPLMEAEGFEVVAVNYPSTRRLLADHADQIEGVIEGLEGIDEVYFVTHSLGGIVLREVLARDSAWKTDRRPVRAVLMGAPNNGSIVARELPAWTSEPVMGKVVRELKEIGPEDLPAPHIEFGIIAGGKGEDGYNPLIPGDDDGVVAVSETHLSGASGFLVIEELHTFLPTNPQAMEAAIRFLKTGQFSA